ncbi:hypothetical protein Bbelb_394130 [Branchiostoma belcheri]|nr:hypothetical protein Bbelb_394130 [Branchiostoma belcheri]
MAGAQFEYDESGGTFLYFLTSVWILFLLPVTYYLWPKGQVEEEKRLQKLEKVHSHSLWYQLKLNKTRSKAKSTAKKVILAIGWIIFLILAYKSSQVERDHVEYDPYEILQIDRGASQADVRRQYRLLSLKHHPDKGGDEDTFRKIAKAYQALTDEETRKNWEEYGNPDGPQATTFGIALPSWIVDSKNSMWVLAAYGVAFMVIMPVAVGTWWYRSIKYSADQVLLDTTQLYYYFFNKTPNMNVKRAVMILAASFEFEKGHNHEVMERPSDNVELPQLMRELSQLNEKSKERPLCYPYSIKARCLVHAHFSRIDLPPKTLELDRQLILRKCPTLVQEMVQVVAQLVALAHAGRVSNLPRLETIENCMKLSQMTVQGLWDNKSPLLQLPHIREDNLRHFVSKRRNIRSIRQLATMDEKDRRALLRNMTDEEYEDVMEVIKNFPIVEMDVQSLVLDDEDTYTITAGAIVTVNCKLKRQSMESVVSQGVEEPPAAEVDEEPEEEEQPEKVRIQEVKAGKDEDSSNSDWEDEPDREDEDGSGSDNDGQRQSEDDDDNWDALQARINRKEKVLETKSKISHTVHAPYFPEEKQEWWWLYVADRKKHSLITAPCMVTSLQEEEEVELKFAAPDKPGTYQYTVCIRSDSYLDFDVMKSIKPYYTTSNRGGYLFGSSRSRGSGPGPDLYLYLILNTGVSPLHDAVIKGDQHRVAQLVQAGEDVDGRCECKLPDLKRAHEFTPLHCAAAVGDLQVIDLLINAGAEVDSQDEVGCSPLHRAVWYNKFDVVQALLSKYAADKDKKNLEGYTPLHLAAKAGHLEILKILLKTGVDLDVVDKVGMTAADHAKEREHLDAVKLLGEYSSKQDATAADSDKTVRLTDRRLSRIPEDVLEKEETEHLFLSRNRLKVLPSSFTRLGCLTKLYLDNNCLSAFPTELFALLDQNQFEEVPAVVLDVGNSLQVLDVAMNKLRHLPEDIDRLEVLERIDAGENKIRTVPKRLCNLSRLRWLSLMDNCIQELPNTFGQLASSLKYLSTTSNPLVQPPYEVCEQGIQAILKYQQELERCNAVVQPRMKMVLLGSPLAGKTSLCHALMENKSRLTREKDRTHCMDVTLWQADQGLQFEVYDFGGHKVYDFVHQFFLSPLAMNVITVDLEQYTSAEFEETVGKWAKALNAHTPGAVIRMVGTHVDRCKPQDVKLKCEDICDQLRRDEKKQVQIIQDQMKIIKDVISDSSIIDIDHPLHGVSRERMLKRYHKLRAMLESRPKLPWCVAPVSSADPLKGIEDLRKELVSLALNKDVFPALRRVLPETWVRLEQRLLAERRKPTLWLTWAEVETLGREAGLSADRLHPAIAYLHRRGVVLHFHDIPDLKTVVFQNPAGLTDILKQLYHHDTDTLMRNIGSLTLDHIQQRQLQDDLLRSGLMSVDTLHHLLKGMKQPPDNMDIVVRLLERFGICYPVPMSGPGDIARAYRVESCSMYQFTWFLTTHMPADVQQLWCPVCPQQQDQLTILCVMRGFTPWGLYERFCAQIDPHIGNRQDWADGILASFGDYPLHVTREVNKENNPSITMATRFETGHVDKAWEGLLKVYGVLRSLLKEWPGLPYTFWIGCCHCLKKEDATKEQPHYFPGDLLRQQRPLGIQSLRCRRCSASETVDIRLVYPPAVTDGQSAQSNKAGQTTYIYNIKDASNVQIGTGNEIRVSTAGRE